MDLYNCGGRIKISLWLKCYCELLINDTIVLPYHYGKPNGRAYRYKIQNDTFYLYANANGTVEASPIKYFDQDSFQILGITPKT